MGISTKPIEDYCIYDSELFPPGKTPRVITVSITGVIQGASGQFGPHCGTFNCQQITDTLWEFRDPEPQPDWTYPVDQRICQYRTDVSGTTVYFVFYHYYSYGFAYSGGTFSFGNFIPLTLFGPNDYATPGLDFYLGSFQAKWKATADVAGSLASDSVLSGMEASSKDLYEPVTADSGSEVMRFARRRDHSCIYTRKVLS